MKWIVQIVKLYELTTQRNQLRLSVESRVVDPLVTMDRFNRQFALEKQEREALEWAWPLEAGETMFHVINTYTRAAQYENLPAESSFRLQKVAGDILTMVN